MATNGHLGNQAATQIDPICAFQPISSYDVAPAPNGGLACGYQDSFTTLARTAVLVTNRPWPAGPYIYVSLRLG